MLPFGIDLGMAYARIAYIDHLDRPVIVKSALGEDTVPSVVYFEAPDSVVVGREAKNSAVLFPDRVVSQIKRQLGKQVQFNFHGQPHTPETISALILKKLAQSAEASTGEQVKDVVITVPAYFGVREREATRKAGEIAGLNVLNLVPEPVAAVLHYRAFSSGDDRTVLVYDLGGSEFAATVIRLHDNDIEVVFTDGDHHLGGVDWDERIVDYLFEEFVGASSGVDPSGDEGFLQELAITAEQLKKDLSRAPVRRSLMHFHGTVTRVELTREAFEEITSGLLERTMYITQRAVVTAKARGVDRFDDVLLVGGATRMPMVAQRLKEQFGFNPRIADPDVVVVKGAARLALIEAVKVARLGDVGVDVVGSGGRKRLSDRDAQQVADQLGLTTDKVQELAEEEVPMVLGRAVGIKVVDPDDPSLSRHRIMHVLEAGTLLPTASRQLIIPTVRPNQTEMQFEVWEQVGSVTSGELEHNALLGEVRISGLPALPVGSPVEVTFRIDRIGILHVHLVDPSTRKDLHLAVELQIGSLGEEEAKQAEAQSGFFVFVSYAHADRTLARTIASQLSSHGIRVWIDEGELRAGDSLAERIAREIAKAEFVVALVSESALKSRWCQKELSLAVSGQLTQPGVRVLPLRVGDVEMPPSLGDVYYRDVDPQDPAAVVPQLVADVRSHYEERHKKPLRILPSNRTYQY
jgi:molecular chaperone DnaK